MVQFWATEDNALVPQYWRLGANAATTFETGKKLRLLGELALVNIAAMPFQRQITGR